MIGIGINAAVSILRFHSGAYFLSFCFLLKFAKYLYFTVVHSFAVQASIKDEPGSLSYEGGGGGS